MAKTLFYLGFTALTAAAVVFTGCGEVVDPPSNNPGQTQTEPPACDIDRSYTYTNSVKAILDAKCTVCHSPASNDRRGSPDCTNLHAYVERCDGLIGGAGAFAVLIAHQAKRGTMPPEDYRDDPDVETLTPEEACVLETWFKQGAVE